jgi:hypothetical protein
MSKDSNVTPIRPRPTPEHVSTGEFASPVWAEAMRLTREHAKNLLADPGLGERLDNELWPGGPVLPSTVPELFFSTNKRHAYVFERVPYGKAIGWRCYDPNKYDGDPADGETSCGYGITEDEAYCDYIGYERPATSAERELDEAIDASLERGE